MLGLEESSFLVLRKIFLVEDFQSERSLVHIEVGRQRLVGGLLLTQAELQVFDGALHLDQLKLRICW